MSDKMLDIYNERMQLLGQKPRKEVHRDGDWHMAFHCWIVYRDPLGDEQIIVQRRSASKDSVPDSLDITAAGHLQAGESPEQGLRELREELGVEVDQHRLVYLGVHVEVYCDDRSINREFDHVYLLEHDTDISEYRVQPDEVVALTRFKISDGIDLFAKRRERILASTVKFDEQGRPAGDPETHRVDIREFAGGERNNYFIKILLLAQRYFDGERLLFI